MSFLFIFNNLANGKQGNNHLQNGIKNKSFYLPNIIIFLIIHFTLSIFFKNLHKAIIAGITGFITAILSPQMKKITTENGDKIQIKWIFSKKTL